MEEKKDLSKILQEATNQSKETGPKITGGLRIKLSDCCNAPIYYINEGLVIPYCSKCKKPYSERKYG